MNLAAHAFVVRSCARRRRDVRARALVALALSVWLGQRPTATSATLLPDGFAEARLAEGLVSPTAIAHAPDGRIFLAQQDGTLRIIENGALLATPFVTLPADDTGERGLLGIALDPDFAVNHYVFVYYAVAALGANRLSRLVADGDVAAPGELVLVELAPYGPAIWHMGGGLHFGADGKLHLGVGDHQNPAAAQSLGNTFGKILRFDREGTIPGDNPFHATASGINRAIWVYGLRNPFSFAFEPGTGRLFIGDVGDAAWEEIDEGAPGANFGWPATEGPTTNPRYVSPVYAYSHSEGCAITGGTFYAPPVAAFPRSYVGGYFFADLCGDWIRWLDPATHTATVFATGTAANPVGLDVGPDGSLYYLSREAGAVYRISYTASRAPQITSQPVSQTIFVGQPARFTVAAAGARTYQWQRNGVDIAGATAPSYTLTAVSVADDGAVFRAVVSNGFGSTTSDDARLTVTQDRAPSATIRVNAPRPTYRAGDTIHFSGSATDPEDGPLGPSAFTWRVDFQHETHAHPFFPPTTGVTAGEFTIPTRGETSPDVWYRITLGVEDSSGRTSTVTRDVYPELARFTLDSSPPGLPLQLDDRSRVTPAAVRGVVNLSRVLGAPGFQMLAGTPYHFGRWSDGGAARHTIAVAPGETTYTAHYVREAAVFLSDLTWTRATNGFGPVELDSSNGGQAPHDGLTVALGGVPYPKGLGVHAPSELVYDLQGRFDTFRADVGLDDEVRPLGSVVFQVWADGVRLYDSGVLNGALPTRTVSVSVAGARELRLVVGDGRDGIAYDHADWAAARLVTPPPCGNGLVEDDEECDDGNDEDGDCCSAACRLEATGSPCSVDEGSAGACDGQGTCVPIVPRTTSTTSTSTTTSTSSTSVTSTSSTTLVEVCGNCLDDDGDGRADLEDPRCCRVAARMVLKPSTIQPRQDGSALRLETTIVRLAGIDPRAQDVLLQLGAAGEPPLLCARIPSARFRGRREVFRFRDPGHRVPSAGNLDRVVLRRLSHGSMRLVAVSQNAPFANPAPGPLQLTVGFSDPAASRCATAGGPFRSGRNGALRFP